MKHLFYLIIILNVGCREDNATNKQQEPGVLSELIEKEIEKEVIQEEQLPESNDQDKWEALPTEWRMITNLNEEFVQYQPCDAANVSVSIMKEKNKIYIGLGQDSDELEIIDWSYTEEDFKDEKEQYYRIQVRSPYEGGKRELVLNFNKNGVSSWSNVIGEEPILFVHEAIFKDYPIVEQPCTDCWEEEDCE